MMWIVSKNAVQIAKYQLDQVERVFELSMNDIEDAVVKEIVPLKLIELFRRQLK